MPANTSPEQKQVALATITLRGPLRSTHLPKTAAESPSKTKAME